MNSADDELAIEGTELAGLVANGEVGAAAADFVVGQPDGGWDHFWDGGDGFGVGDFVGELCGEFEGGAEGRRG